MDLNFNEVPLGPDYSQLSLAEKQRLLQCLEKLAPISWDETTLRTWYVNRKLTVLREPESTKFFALTSANEWRLVLTESAEHITWHVQAMFEPIAPKVEAR